MKRSNYPPIDTLKRLNYPPTNTLKRSNYPPIDTFKRSNYPPTDTLKLSNYPASVLVMDYLFTWIGLLRSSTGSFCFRYNRQEKGKETTRNLRI